MPVTILENGKHYPYVPPPVPSVPAAGRRLRVLVACEMSGRVRDAIRARGHDAWSCDVMDSIADSRWHIRGDVREVLGEGWDMMIAFPPCTDLSVIGAKYWAEKEADGRQREALEFVRVLMQAPIDRVVIENPVGKINTAIRKPSQIIQPWWFGDPWMKRTCLWIKGLPLLLPDQVVDVRGHWVDGGSRVLKKHVEYGDERFGSSTDAARKVERSKTFPGIARAMAEQWTHPYND